MKIYVLCQLSLDYLEIWEYITVLGVYTTRNKAKAAAKKAKITDYHIEVKEMNGPINEISLYK